MKRILNGFCIAARPTIPTLDFLLHSLHCQVYTHCCGCALTLGRKTKKVFACTRRLRLPIFVRKPESKIRDETVNPVDRALLVIEHCVREGKK